MKDQRGFTLLEMLAAIVLLGVFASVLLGGFGQSARSLVQVGRSDRLDTAVRSVMDELDSQPVEEGTRRGTWNDFSWILKTTRESGQPGGVILYRWDLQVSDGRREVHYATLRARSDKGLP